MVANSGTSLKLRERSFLAAIIKMLTLRQEYSKKVNASFKGLNQCSPRTAEMAIEHGKLVVPGLLDTGATLPLDILNYCSGRWWQRIAW